VNCLAESEYNPKKSEDVSFKETKPPKLRDRRFFRGTAWSREQYKLEHSEQYGPVFLNEFKRRFEAAVAYLLGSQISEVAKEYKLSMLSIKRFGRDLIIGKTLEEIIRNQLGYKGNAGLEFAIGQLRIFYKRNNKIPTSKDEGVGGIPSAGYDGRWAEFGVESWNDLLKMAFGEIARAKFVGIDGLVQAMNDLQEFERENGRIPSSNDTGLGGIQSAISRGEWTLFGIKTWNDLLKSTFGRVNLERGKYYGIEGLTRAINELRDFKNQNHRLPIAIDKGMNTILRTIRDGEWSAFGITKWNQLLKESFGEVNHNFNKYTGREGLETAINELKEFKKQNNRIPVILDEGMRGISAACYHHQWVLFGIETWNDLLKLTFGEINRENKYVGVEGLNRAINELWELRIELNRIPVLQDDGMAGIVDTICRGEWSTFGIETWNDLLRTIFGEINHDINKYIGKAGLELARKKLEKFKRENKRFPKAKDKGMMGISSACYNGRWVEFGIKSWNDLLNSTFGEVNHNFNKYTGKKGFDRVIHELKVFKKTYGRLPNNKDRGMGTISYCCYDGYWKDFVIRNWSDLLEYIFNENNQKVKKYEGKKGLELAVSKLREFKQKNKRLPLLKDRGMGGIRTAINRRQWIKFGIETWNDLLLRVFNEVNKHLIRVVKKMDPTYIPRIKAAIEEIKREKKRLTKSEVAKRARISRITIDRYPKLMKIINNAIESNNKV